MKVPAASGSDVRQQAGAVKSAIAFSGQVAMASASEVLSDNRLQLSPQSRVGAAQALPSAFIRRLTSRASAIDWGESTSATVCHVAACASQPRG